MTIHEIIEEWFGLTDERKSEAFLRLIDHVKREHGDDDGMYAVLDALASLESEDFFGTEGAAL